MNGTINPTINYQQSNIRVKKCKDCTQTECTKLYDHHHDLHYSETCGTVILQSNTYHVDYYSDPDYWEKQYQKREEAKQKREIIKVIQEELGINYQIHEDGTIQLPNLTSKQINRLTYLCEGTPFKLTPVQIHDENNTYLGLKYIIKKEKKENKEKNYK